MRAAGFSVFLDGIEDHFDPDRCEQQHGNPMIDRPDFFAESDACEPADHRHQRLKARKAQCKL